MTSAHATDLWELRFVSHPKAPGGGQDAERALFASARAGSEEATRSLCEGMRPLLFRVAWSFLQDRDEAEDVAQEALVRALTRRFAWLEGGSARGFLVRVATNLAKNRLRDRRRRRRLLEAKQERVRESVSGEPASRPDAGLRDEEERALVASALEALSARQQEVVRLRLFGELSFAEVAAALGIKEENARVTFSQAKARLIAALGPARAGKRP